MVINILKNLKIAAYIEECEDILNKLSKRTTVEIKHDEQANLKIYEDNFTSEKFLYNYEKLIQSL